MAARRARSRTIMMDGSFQSVAGLVAVKTDSLRLSFTSKFVVGKWAEKAHGTFFTQKVSNRVLRRRGPGRAVVAAISIRCHGCGTYDRPRIRCPCRIRGTLHQSPAYS